MKQWSRYFQNEEFLEHTRMFVLNDDMKDYVAQKIGLRSGMKVLDVGCGTGAFGRYLSRSVGGVNFIGLDYDENFVKAAKQTENDSDNGCTFSFLQGDARQLPFEAETFDAVVSHTFFNSMPQYRLALREMLRVCRQDGVIASITAMDLQNVPTSPGIYPKDADYWKKDYDLLFAKVQALYEKIVAIKDYLQGIPTAYIPNLFERERLREVSAYPIGHFFSLSNHAVSEEVKRKYIELSYISDKKRFSCVYEEEEAKTIITKEEAANYLALLEQKKDYLLQHIKNNQIWEWIGCANLLVTGRKPNKNELLMDTAFSSIRKWMD